MNRLDPMVPSLVYEFTNSPLPLDAAIEWAAVAAWYEGHVAAEEPHKNQKLGDIAEGRPAPPFPNPESETLADVIRQACGIFKSEELRGPAVAYAVGLAYAAGFAEGRTCAGCTFRIRPPTTDAKRSAGEVPLVLFNGKPTTRIVHNVTAEERDDYRGLAEKLWAAVLSDHERVGADYFLKRNRARLDAKGIGDYWISLAKTLSIESAENMMGALGGNFVPPWPSDDA